MTISLILALYAIIAAVALPGLLASAGWTERAPRLGIAIWQAACVSVVASAVLAALAIALPPSAIGHDLVGLFEACAALLSGQGDGLATMTAAGRLTLLTGALIVSRLTYCGAAVLLQAHQERRRHAEMLILLGRHDGELDAIVLRYGEAAAYCLPGRRGKTVITTGALQSLTAEQVAAVLAHERAHLRGRHHLVLAAAEAHTRAFPCVPLFVKARSEIARLVELLADDVAARRHPRIHIAAALVALATGHVPAYMLGAGGENALTRVRRMLHPALPLGRRERLAGVLAVGALLAGPAALAVFPGVSAFLTHHCHHLSSLLW